MSSINKVDLKGTGYDVVDNTNGSLKSCNITAQKSVGPTDNLVYGADLFRPDTNNNLLKRGFIPTAYANNYALQLVRSNEFHKISSTRYSPDQFEVSSYVNFASSNINFNDGTAVLAENTGVDFSITPQGYTALLESGYGDYLFMIAPKVISMSVTEKLGYLIGTLKFYLSEGDSACPIMPYPYVGSPQYYAVRAKDDDNSEHNILYTAKYGTTITGITSPGGSQTASNPPKWSITGASSVMGTLDIVPPFDSALCSDFILQSLGVEGGN